jgi:hypothetical protein
MMGKTAEVAVRENEAVDYRSDSPWDFGLAPEILRRVTACAKARIRRAEVPFGGERQLLN